MIALSLILVALLAFANGANDNCKGVATLVGFGAASPRRALAWAPLTTAIGAAISFAAAGGLIKAFSKGLFTDGASLTTPFFAAVLIGAVAWIILANLTGMPVSTTHAIMGGLLGAGLVALSRHQIRWPLLGSSFAMPLATSPLIAMAAVYLLSWPVSHLVNRYANRCVCIAQPAPQPVGSALAMTSAPTLIADTTQNCAQAGAVGISTSALANAIHWTSSGLIGFARGWNDAPKIAALALGALAATGVSHIPAIAFAIVTISMAAGGLLAGRKVLETLARRLTPLPLAQSLVASLTTAGLVCAASWISLPVSTTHVATGSIIGAGLRNDPRQIRWGKLGEVLLSWIITLPVAGLVAAAAMYVLR